jgi:hypothetical protein
MRFTYKEWAVDRSNREGIELAKEDSSIMSVDRKNKR